MKGRIESKMSRLELKSIKNLFQKGKNLLRKLRNIGNPKIGFLNWIWDFNLVCKIILRNDGHCGFCLWRKNFFQIGSIQLQFIPKISTPLIFK